MEGSSNYLSYINFCDLMALKYPIIQNLAGVQPNGAELLVIVFKMARKKMYTSLMTKRVIHPGIRLKIMNIDMLLGKVWAGSLVSTN